MLACPDRGGTRDARVQLTRRSSILLTPRECYLISLPEQKILRRLYESN